MLLNMPEIFDCKYQLLVKFKKIKITPEIEEYIKNNCVKKLVF